MRRDEIVGWLRETDRGKLGELWWRADALRRRCVGDAVHLRGLVELSNKCARQCGYCGLRAGNAALPRYRMTHDEILACARMAQELGYGTLVLQSGEDPTMDPEWLAGVVRQITTTTPLAVTLSLGEWGADVLGLWREAGADRYLLRFETADEELFQRIHPPMPGRPSSRFEVLRSLRELGYEVGSGILIGFPGQSYDELARCIEVLRELELDMIGSGPFIPHPDTPLGGSHGDAAPDQVPADDLMTYKVLALARIVRPYANIPATTALATLDKASGYERGLQRGANVIMPNLTPVRYRTLYEVYPGKTGTAPKDTYYDDIKARIEALGRTVGVGPGSSACRTGAAAHPA
ncbi:MAG TPA: [FeFe] hydrogenase H-cluster radical SAM maturase HydE [Longimicrobiales bacterium]|nr:[FeFe] hydrogenase H-cluster radical SAM maturase HydE [Longimicrobiales bacterium]